MKEDSYPIVEVIEGEGRLQGRMGALVVEVDGGKRIHVGTGFSDGERKFYWRHRDAVKGGKIDVAFHDRDGQAFTGPRYLKPASDSEIDLLQACAVGGMNEYAMISGRR